MVSPTAWWDRLEIVAACLENQGATEGVPIYAAQTLLGHSTVQMTMRYAHLAPSALRSSVEVLHDAEKRDAERLGNTWATTGEHKANEPLLPV